jgi:hypothetical protein
MDIVMTWGREICGEVDAAERREWLCTNGIGGFAFGTVAGIATRRNHRRSTLPNRSSAPTA